MVNTNKKTKKIQNEKPKNINNDIFILLNYKIHN